MTKKAVLIVAAGSGTRLGGVPKQYRILAGKSVLRRSVEAFAKRPDISHIQVVVGENQDQLYADCLGEMTLPPPVIGGATRQQSVLNGLHALAAIAPDIVLIHDAARPLVSDSVIDSVIVALAEYPAATPALPVTDSLRRGTSIIEAELSRDNVYTVQTPQGFHFGSIFAAHRTSPEGFTDDAGIAHAAGLAVALTPGASDNFKITLESDLRRAEKILMQAMQPRTGMGFDVHQFGPGDHIWLCGVKIPHDKGIIAHSDGDVALHALTDAILGAIAAGDIGLHFPPSDNRWKNAPSSDFVAHANKLLREAGGIISHIDLTIICEKPKVTQHRDNMRHSIASMLGMDVSCVSVKATTTERLGFTGRGEGIAAQALATVMLP